MAERPARTKVLLDVDPGHDDALAILTDAALPELELVGVTTVAGNQTLAKTTRNARAVLTLGGIRVPLAAGAERPLVRAPILAANIHGESGLDGADLPAPTTPLDPRPAAGFIIDSVRAHPGEITLVPTGPLTNIALALRLAPDLVEKVPRISLMGGAIGKGNTTASAEFNILSDPEAAHIVFSSGIPITMSGLDLTHQALADDAVIARLRAMDSAVARAAVGWLEFFGESYRREEGLAHPPVHDVCAVMAVAHPEVIETQALYVVVEIRGEHTVGRTVCDLRGRPHPAANADVGVRLERDRFWQIVLDALATYGDRAMGA
jgi:purine nucleosidase